MRVLNLAKAGPAVALAAVMALSGCAEPEPRVVTVTPPVIAVAPGGGASDAAAPVAPTAVAPTFQTRIGVEPLAGDREIRLQSFAGDVCVADDRGGGFVSHCVCAGSECTCQGASGSCNP
jgi:hypothetical protein